MQAPDHSLHSKNRNSGRCFLNIQIHHSLRGDLIINIFGDVVMRNRDHTHCHDRAQKQRSRVVAPARVCDQLPDLRGIKRALKQQPVCHMTHPESKNKQNKQRECHKRQRAHWSQGH